MMIRRLPLPTIDETLEASAAMLERLYASIRRTQERITVSRALLNTYSDDRRRGAVTADEPFASRSASSVGEEPSSMSAA